MEAVIPSVFMERWGVSPGMVPVEVGPDFVTIAIETTAQLAVAATPVGQKSGSAPSSGNGAGPPPAEVYEGGLAPVAGFSFELSAEPKVPEEVGRMQEMLWTVDLPSAEVRMRLAAERASISPFSLLTRTEAVEKSLVEALGFDVDGIARREGLHYVKVKKIVAGSVAYRHGVKVGDILEAVGGRPAVYETRTGFFSSIADSLKAHTADTPRDGGWLRFLLARPNLPDAGESAPKGGETAIPYSTTSEFPRRFDRSTEGETAGGGASARAAIVQASAAGAPLATKPRATTSGRGKKARGRAPARAVAAPPPAATPLPASTRENEKPPASKPIAAPSSASTRATGHLPFSDRSLGRKKAAQGEGTGAQGKGAGAAVAPACDGERASDAVPLKTQAQQTTAAAAKKYREQRANARGGHVGGVRPIWWRKAAKGSTLHWMKLRPANMLPARDPQAAGGDHRQAGEETKGGETSHQESTAGEPVPPGAFLLEPLEIGTGSNMMVIPAGVKLIRVGKLDCRNMTYQEAREVALAGSSQVQLVFDDP